MADNLSSQGRYRHETTDVQDYTIVWIGVVLLLVIVLGGTFVFALMELYENKQQEMGTGGPLKKDLIVERIPPAPYLEASSGAGWTELRKKNEDLLHSYGWVNKKKGSFHIPIEYAMELLAKRHSQDEQGKDYKKKDAAPHTFAN
ncbi:hypothetical protein [Nitrosococcus watsonii]|uniref:Uncharacterized protein n=1 Tax=Nitrosococcus watsoni (strain C-113) TaxID=105559 RepID=D8K588_NITWC|nr:hypothetical protein [Nitrosococcus watsonii]ADJ28065.1 conserved hypothetical protein [Nitrosococcus watsonii C-113]